MERKAIGVGLGKFGGGGRVIQIYRSSLWKLWQQVIVSLALAKRKLKGGGGEQWHPVVGLFLFTAKWARIWGGMGHSIGAHQTQLFTTSHRTVVYFLASCLLLQDSHPEGGSTLFFPPQKKNSFGHLKYFFSSDHFR